MRKFVTLLISALGLAGVIIFAANNGSGANGADTEAAVKGSVIINEIMASNSGSVLDESGENADWVELYNTTDQAVDMSGWGLSDVANAQGGIKWAFPSGFKIEAKSYAVIFCSGKNISDVTAVYQHTNFKLKSSGEYITLFDASSNAIDTASFTNMNSNCSYGLVAGNMTEWKEFTDPTPGYENSDEGRQVYLASLASSDVDILIDELMAVNSTTLADVDGEYSDWIEIHNPSDQDVNLTGFGLSDDINVPHKWTFSDVTIKAGEYLVVFASGKSELNGDQLHTSFRLDAQNENVVLSDRSGKLISSVTYEEQSSDVSYALDADNNWEACMKPTPGYANTDAGFAEFEKTTSLGQSGLIISEAMLSNESYAEAQDGECYDWIELYNGTSSDIDLNGYGLTDKTKNLLRWRFPEGTVIKAGQYLVVQASGKNITDTSAQYMHTNFKLSTTGVVIALSDPDGKLIDRLNVSMLSGGMSYGRLDGQSVYFKTPTPGEANSTGYAVIAEKPQIQLAAGIYDGPQTVEISVPEGATVRYTIDGSIPTESSTEYTGAFTVSKNTPVRARAFVPGQIESEVDSNMIFVGISHSLPVLSISIAPDDMYSNERGIYVKGSNSNNDLEVDKNRNYWQEWERPVHFEYFTPDGKLNYEVDAAFRIFGAYSRERNQKGFALIARSEYGASSLDYPFFSDRDCDSYKSIIFRAGGQDCTVTKVRDIVCTSIAGDYTTLETQAYVQAVLYVNGEYFGVYNIREKITKYFLQLHYGINPDNVDIIVGNNSALQGDNKEWKALNEWLETHSLANSENYEYFKSKFDIENAIDYLFSEMYVMNTDSGNIKMFREKTDTAKWRYLYYDFCWSLGSDYTRDPFVYWLNPAGHGVGKGFSTLIPRRLFENKRVCGPIYEAGRRTDKGWLFGGNVYSAL